MIETVIEKGLRPSRLVRHPAKDLRKALQLVAARRWREIPWWVRLRIRQVDLRHESNEEIGISPVKGSWYSNSGGPDLDAVLRVLGIRHGDALVDLGCGKGGALIMLARHPFSRITGVDLSPKLIPIAGENLRKMRINSVDLHCMDAADFCTIDGYNYLYLSNPFPCEIMQSVLDRLIDSLTRIPRRFTIIYQNPQCHETIMATGLFEKTFEFPSSSRKHFLVYSSKDDVRS